MEAVPTRYRKGYGSEYREDDEEECSQRVYDKGCGIEHQFQQFTEEVLNSLFHIVHRTVHIHSASLNRIQRTEFIELVVKRLLIHEVGRFGIAFHRLKFQLILLLAILVHIEGLRFKDSVRSRHDGRHHAVERAQHQCREEHDTQSESKGTQERKDIYRLGSCQ